jgi:hypothetical protein
MLGMLALHYLATDEKKFWSSAAVLFAVMYNVFATINYVVQLTATIPYNVTSLAQTTHSLFWTLDSLAYIFGGFATLFAVSLFAKQGLEKRIRWFFLSNCIITVPLMAVVYYGPNWTGDWHTGYWAPQAFLGFSWVVTAVGSYLLLSLYLGRRWKSLATIQSTVPSKQLVRMDPVRAREADSSQGRDSPQTTGNR